MIEEWVKAHSFPQIIGLGCLYIFMMISLQKYHFSLYESIQDVFRVLKSMKKA